MMRIRFIFPLALLLVMTVAAAAGPLPQFKPPTILPADQALIRGKTEGMELKFIELGREGGIKVWGYLQGPIWRAAPAVLFFDRGRWMVAVYDNSPDLAQAGFWYVGRDPEGYIAVLDSEIEGAFGELIIARSSDGIRWRPVGVLRKENFTQLFQELQVFPGGRWLIATDYPADQWPNGRDYVWESGDGGMTWRLARKAMPVSGECPVFRYYLSPLIAAPGNLVRPMVMVSGRIKNPGLRSGP